METIEGNKLIADFNNYLQRAKDEKDPYLYAMQHAYDNGNLKYHSSWEWLMPVVEKIESMGFDVQIKLGMCCISKNGNQIVFYAEKLKIESVWMACVGFIQYHSKWLSPLKFSTK